MPESGDPSTSPVQPPPSDTVGDAGRSHDVFVSYASQDVEVANAIVAVLERSVRGWLLGSAMRISIARPLRPATAPCSSMPTMNRL